MSQYLPGHFDFPRGEPVPLEEMRRLDRIAAGVENATIVAQAGAAGADGIQLLAPPPRLAFWARITGGGNGGTYVFQEVQDAGLSQTGISWINVVGGMVGSEAREVNGNNTLLPDPTTGPVVWMVQSEANERWLFEFSAGAVGDTFNWTNVTIIATNVTIDVYQQFIWNLFGPIIFNPPPGTVPGPTGPPGPQGSPGPKGPDGKPAYIGVNVPLKLDDWVFLNGGTYTFTGADLGLVSHTIDNWIPPVRRTVWKLQSAGGGTSTTITGIVPAAPPAGSPPGNGQLLILINISPYRFTLKHQSVSSAAGNGFILPDGANFDLVIVPGGGVGLWHDPGSGYWYAWTMEAGGQTGTSQQFVNSIDWVLCTNTLSAFDLVNGRIRS